MNVYHGSTVCVPTPRLLAATRRLDFGAGFYTTSDLRQAARWASIKKRRMMTREAYVSRYDASALVSAENVAFKHFITADAEWLDFVMLHRMGDANPSSIYDVVRGPVANDTLYETLSLYERKILTHAETIAIARLRTHQLADQIVLASPAALGLLAYEGCEEVLDG